MSPSLDSDVLVLRAVVFIFKVLYVWSFKLHVDISDAIPVIRRCAVLLLDEVEHPLGRAIVLDDQSRLVQVVPGVEPVSIDVVIISTLEEIVELWLVVLHAAAEVMVVDVDMVKALGDVLFWLELNELIILEECACNSLEFFFLLFL